MSRQEESLAVVAPGMTPSLPTEIALAHMSKIRVQEPPPHFDPPGNEWVKAYFPKPTRSHRRDANQSESSTETREEERQTDLSRILLKLKSETTPPQASSESVVLYAEPQKKAKKKSFTPSTPTLEAPSKSAHCMKEHINIALAIEEVSSKMIQTEESCIEWICGWVSNLTNKLIEHIRDASEIFSQRDQWSILAKVASGILAGISIIFGISLVTSPAGGLLIGGLLIASGLLSVVNLILEETRAWDWVATQIAGDDKQLRDQLRVWIPAGVGMLSMAVGAAGSIGALFMESFNMVHQMLLMGKSVTDIAKHISEMAKGVATSKSIESQAESEHIQTKIDLTDTHLKGAMDALKQINGAVTRSFSSAARCLTAYARAAQMRDIQA